MTAPVRPVTRGPHAHFFGYYDKCPWDVTGRYMLGIETPFIDRPPTAADAVVIGLIDTQEDFGWRPLAETRAWNWQMSCRLHWLPTAADRKIIFNAREEDRFVSVILDVFNGETRTLPRSIYDLSRDGKTAFTLNFSRLADHRPGYGYAGLVDPGRNNLHPDNDGLWRLDMETGSESLIVSYAQVAAFQPNPTMKGVSHWFNHILINPSGTRLFFFHRWRRWEGTLASWHTRVFTVNPDGSDLFVVPNLQNASHYDWLDDNHVLIESQDPTTREWQHVLVTDRTTERTILGPGTLRDGGHSSFSPDRHWLLTDTYPDKNGLQTMMLFRLADQELIEIGRFPVAPQVRGEIRCDLHPRWNRDGTQICFDSTHEGNRQMYVADVVSITRG